MITTNCSGCGVPVEGNNKFCSSCGGGGGGKISGDLEMRVLDLLRQNELIPAIKLVREKTGMGLKEAADYTKGLAAKNGIVVEGSPGSLIVLVVVSVVLLAAVGLVIYFAAAG